MKHVNFSELLCCARLISCFLSLRRSLFVVFPWSRSSRDRWRDTMLLHPPTSRTHADNTRGYARIRARQEIIDDTRSAGVSCIASHIAERKSTGGDLLSSTVDNRRQLHRGETRFAVVQQRVGIPIFLRPINSSSALSRDIRCVIK